MAKRWLRIGLDDPSEEQYTQLAFLVLAAANAMDLDVVRFESDGRQEEYALERFWEDFHDGLRRPPWDDD
ncbi:hypothetical protein [Actinomadura terrae]|uniref:hypothetical protein n=1 Tax=Actinomadura terrae TaxID=604353 RepID=UPI001FA779BD|nr:hypothetical protein [Actinomadura terrae]